jgi:hypothetical protein
MHNILPLKNSNLLAVDKILLNCKFVVSGQLHAQAILTPGKNPQYPLYRRLGEPQSGEEKTLPCQDSEYDPSVIQHLTSHYTNYAVDIILLCTKKPVPNSRFSFPFP